MSRSINALLAAALMCLSIFTNVAYSKTESNVATLTESHGTVFKRGFIDWKKELWDEPFPAQKGDNLEEGTQLATGNRSWAQISWPYITTRAWSNALYAIAPNRRLVYLLGGEVLYHLDKHRKNRNEYFVWTKLVQVRLRGTTVFVQATKERTRLTVLEGCIDVMNRSDRSVVRLLPGTVYEVRDISGSILPAADLRAAPGTNGETSGETSYTPSEITNAAVAPIRLFQTRKTETLISLADPAALLKHPLLTGFQKGFVSLPLIQRSLSKLASDIYKAEIGDKKLPTKAVACRVQIISVPRLLSYTKGPELGKTISLNSQDLIDFPAKDSLEDSQYAPAISGLPNVNSSTTAPGRLPQATSSPVPAGSLSASATALSGMQNSQSSLLNFTGNTTTNILYQLVGH